MPQAAQQMRFVFLVLLLAVGGADGRSAEPADQQSITEDVRQLNSARPEDRVEAAKRLIVRPKESVPELLAAIASFDVSSVEGLPEDRLLYLIAITDVLRAIVVESFDAVKATRIEVRRMDRRRVLAPLIAGTGSDDRSLRINATVILASIIDNATVCLVLQRLRNGSRNAREKINLIQVVASMAGYAYRENVAAAAATVRQVRAQERVFDAEDWRRIASFLDEVEQGVSKSVNKDVDTPPFEDGFCKGFAYDG